MQYPSTTRLFFHYSTNFSPLIRPQFVGEVGIWGGLPLNSHTHTLTPFAGSLKVHDSPLVVDILRQWRSTINPLTWICLFDAWVPSCRKFFSKKSPTKQIQVTNTGLAGIIPGFFPQAFCWIPSIFSPTKKKRRPTWIPETSHPARSQLPLSTSQGFWWYCWWFRNPASTSWGW